MKDSMPQELVMDALSSALGQRNINPGLIFHSDRGSQYSVEEFRNLLKKHQMIPSMSRTGNCWDNAVAESFFHTLKTEYVNHQSFKTQQEATAGIFEYIEVFYNRQRLHSKLGYIAPFVFEQLQQNLIVA